MISPERIEVLQAGWVRLLERYGVGPAAAYTPFDTLVAAYSAPQRYYHNLEHLAEMFRVTGRLAAICDDPDAVHLAIWFHDAVHDPRADDNEEQSAGLAARLLGLLNVDRAVIHRVDRLVRSTAHLASSAGPVDRDTAVLLDADLAILGASKERYRRYSAEIRKEYGFVPETDYRVGRTAVLQKFLDRPRIFHTACLFEEGEMRARQNMTAERDELR